MNVPNGRSLQTAALDVPALVRDLSRIEIAGQLDELLQQFARDCRGLPADHAQLHRANELLHVQRVAQAIAGMFDLPVDQCNAAARCVLLPQPRREAALDLIDVYSRRAPEPLSDTAPGDRENGEAGGVVRGKLSSAPSCDKNPTHERQGVTK